MVLILVVFESFTEGVDYLFKWSSRARWDKSGWRRKDDHGQEADQAALSGSAEHREEMYDADPDLEGRPQSLRDHLRRPRSDRAKNQTGNRRKTQSDFPTVPTAASI